MLNKYVIGLAIIGALISAFVFQQYRYAQLETKMATTAAENDSLSVAIATALNVSKQLTAELAATEKALEKERTESAEIYKDYADLADSLKRLEQEDEDTASYLSIPVPSALLERLLVGEGERGIH